MSRQRGILLFIASLTLCAFQAAAQPQYLPEKLDLTGDIASPRLESASHHPLPEQYIWGQSAAPDEKEGDGAKALYFRDTFKLHTAPSSATLYIAGPDHIQAYLNGQLLANAERDPKSRLRPMVLSLNAAGHLHAGANTLAIEAAGGDRLVAKIVPSLPGVMAPAVAMSGPQWKYNISVESHWEQPSHNDGNWKPVRALGGIESDIEFFQWNNDAGMYRWPGYDGISPFLAHLPAPVESVLDVFEGLGRISNVGAITPLSKSATGLKEAGESRGELSVALPPAGTPEEEYPYVVLDLGRESDGRLEIASDSAAPMKLGIQYGESLQEAENQPYLDLDELDVQPHATVHGPKSAFRYAVVRFLGGTSPLRIKSIRLDSIYYPVKYQGSFESSDPLLNRIWQVGAYTTHLSMQDGIWDAPKRDRGRWMGDLDVSGRVIDTAFGDQFLMQDTIDRLIKEAGDPVHADINTIPGYSAFWIMGQADYYRHTGNREYLKSIVEPLSQLLEYMESELDDRKLFVNGKKAWPFVDWSPDLNEDTAEARRATHLEFAKAFTEGTWLLQEADADPEDIAKFRLEAQQLKFAAQNFLLDPATNTFGPRWQTNAMAIFSGVADDKQTADIWDKVLSQPRRFMITPYYNFYVITAMAEAGHRREALDWIRQFWGGMIEEGATSFWEAYDPSWPKGNFHESLQADNGQGYFVSLCHGWSSGPTAWLTEQVLGIQPQSAGFADVNIRPDLAGLEWARGTEPTPHGPIKVDLHARGDVLDATLDVPDGVTAEVAIPARKGSTAVALNGQSISATPTENGTRVVVEISKAGHYQIEPR